MKKAKKKGTSVDTYKLLRVSTKYSPKTFLQPFYWHGQEFGMALNTSTPSTLFSLNRRLRTSDISDPWYLFLAIIVLILSIWFWRSFSSTSHR